MSDQNAADRWAVQDVLSNYTMGVDERDMVQYRNCFTDDVEVVGFGAEVYNGGNEWTAYVIEALKAYGATQHMLGPMFAQIDGDNAKTRTDVQAHHYLIDDDKTTLTLWHKAAELGHMRAQNGLGVLYRDGDAGKPDKKRAAYWFRRSAENGYVYAMYSLAMLYRDGDGVARNDVEAHMWFDLASSLNFDPKAIFQRDLIARRMDAEQGQSISSATAFSITVPAKKSGFNRVCSRTTSSKTNAR